MNKQMENVLNYRFKNIALLKEAFTHSSYANEKKINPLHSNERLEFLGDAVLELVISNYLFNNFKDLSEGQLSKYRAAVVCEESFAKISRRLQLGDFLKLGKGENQSGGSNRNSILADVYEAVIGAVYLDSDFATVEKVILDLMIKDILNLKNTFEVKDYKTYLQEIIQAQSQLPIKYFIESEEGPAHDKIFKVNVIHNDKIIGKGIGKTKKEAEQNSAKSFLVKHKYI